MFFPTISQLGKVLRRNERSLRDHFFDDGSDELSFNKVFRWRAHEK